MAGLAVRSVGRGPVCNRHCRVRKQRFGRSCNRKSTRGTAMTSRLHGRILELPGADFLFRRNRNPGTGRRPSSAIARSTRRRMPRWASWNFQRPAVELLGTQGAFVRGRWRLTLSDWQATPWPVHVGRSGSFRRVGGSSTTIPAPGMTAFPFWESGICAAAIVRRNLLVTDALGGVTSQSGHPRVITASCD